MNDRPPLIVILVLGIASGYGFGCGFYFWLPDSYLVIAGLLADLTFGYSYYPSRDAHLGADNGPG
jgi:hypothetical protein